jgi:PAS domain S-box-containing protein
MEPLQVGTQMCFAVGLAVGVYQLWFRRRRPERREASWGAVASFAGAIYAGMMGLAYGLGPSLQVRPLIQVVMVSMVVACHAVPGFAAALHGRPIPGWRKIWPVSVLFWSSLIMFSPWIVTPDFIEIQLTLSPRPFPVFVSNIGTKALLTCNLAIATFGAWWLLVDNKLPRSARLTFAGFAIWIFGGFLDRLTTSGLIEQAPMFFAEYGVLALGLGILGDSQSEYVGLLDKQRATIRASRESLHTLLEQSPELIAVHRDGRFVYINPAGLRLLGFETQDALIGTPVLDIIDPQDREQAGARIEQLQAGSAPLPPVRERLLTRDGQSLVSEVISLSVRFDDRHGIMMLGRDLTQRSQLERKMVQMDRMVAVGALAAGVAHEINNPLMSVLMNIEVATATLGTLQETAGQGETSAEVDDLREVLADVTQGGNRIRDIVRDLADLSRPRDVDLVPTDVLEAARGSINLVKNQIVHRATLDVSLSPVARVMADPGKLSQVFINLLMNAADSLKGDRDEQRIRVRSEMRGEQVVISIEDTGVGITPEQRERLFEPFFTTKAIGEGSGLGLAITHQIVTSFGGEIEVETKLGAGSTFRVVLPAAEALSSTPADGPAGAQHDASEQPARVLIIDDEPLVLRAMTRMLARSCNVQGVDRATKALELLEAGNQYDVILCDLMMPGMSGAEFDAAVHERLPHLSGRIVYMTGGAMGAEAEEFVDCLASPPLSKPIDYKALLALIQARGEAE